MFKLYQQHIRFLNLVWGSVESILTFYEGRTQMHLACVCPSRSLVGRLMGGERRVCTGSKSLFLCCTGEWEWWRALLPDLLPCKHCSLLNLLFWQTLEPPEGASSASPN